MARDDHQLKTCQNETAFQKYALHSQFETYGEPMFKFWFLHKTPLEIEHLNTNNLDTKVLYIIKNPFMMVNQLY